MSDTLATQPPDSLLRDFLLSPADLFDLAAAHKLSLDGLIAWWTDPATQARIRALEDIAEARRDIRAKLHAAKAIDRLSALSESTGNQPNERRHCANALLKHAPTARASREPRRATDRSLAMDRTRATERGASPRSVDPSHATSPSPESARTHDGSHHPASPAPAHSYRSSTTYTSYPTCPTYPSPETLQVQSPLNALAPRDQGRSPNLLTAAAGAAARGGAAAPPISVFIA